MIRQAPVKKILLERVKESIITAEQYKEITGEEIHRIMNTNIQLIEELTEICIQQAKIIKEQAFILEQLGAQSLEDRRNIVQVK